MGVTVAKRRIKHHQACSADIVQLISWSHTRPKLHPIYCHQANNVSFKHALARHKVADHQQATVTLLHVSPVTLFVGCAKMYYWQVLNSNVIRRKSTVALVQTTSKLPDTQTSPLCIPALTICMG